MSLRKSKTKPETILRWIARLWGVVSTLLLLAFVLGGREHLQFTVREAMAFLLFPCGVVAGFAVAWRRELAGGLITVGSLTVFYILLFASAGKWPGNPWFVLFAAPGFLHVANRLTAARRLRRVVPGFR